MYAGSGASHGGLPQKAGVTPLGSSIIIKSLSDMQGRLANAIDAHIANYPLPGVQRLHEEGGSLARGARLRPRFGGELF